MPIKDPKELVVNLLSVLHQGTERSAKVYHGLSELAEDAEVKEALQARSFVSGQVLVTLDECFKLIGEKPVKVNSPLRETVVEDFRKEFAEIQSPLAKRLFILVKAIHFTHLRLAEYEALVAAADLTGHHGVGVLLESCLANKLAFIERTRRMIRELVVAKVITKIAASAAA